MKRQWHKDAVKIFRIIQTIMGDREIARAHLDSTSSVPSLAYCLERESKALALQVILLRVDHPGPVPETDMPQKE